MCISYNYQPDPENAEHPHTLISQCEKMVSSLLGWGPNDALRGICDGNDNILMETFLWNF